MSCDSSNHTRTYKLPKQNHEQKSSIVNEKQDGNGDLKWEKPASWTSSEGSSMRIASFSVPYKGGEGDLSVIQLSGEGGGLESNVNRWRRQLNMTPISLEEIEKNINVQSGTLGKYNLIKIVNDQTNKAFMCAIVPVQNQTLFIKLSMNANYLQDIEEDFISFCSSLNSSN
jgi:hypothetical protein